ncbi:calcium-binding protein [Sphingomonas sp.]|uniref:calcium-binding protein n=1 Tax=Sphingomonas sp. TaxID=28214 RepID=UPI0035C7DF39
MVDETGFDRDFYLRTNPDVAAAGVDPYQHFLRFGWRERRNPNILFDTRYYLDTNPDVAAAQVDPLSHYMNFGWREGRDPSAAFDTSNYLDTHRDVAAAGINPALHYLNYGQAEGRVLTRDYATELREGFDRAYYLKANPDLAGAGIDPYVHYQAYGRAEGRAPNAFFDQAFYLARNPDVAAAGVDPLRHFLKDGWREGRDPSANFSLSEYRTAMRTPADDNPLTRYLAVDRYAQLPSDLNGPNPPQIIQARGQALDAILAGAATFAIDGALTRVTATASPLDGHDLSGFTNYHLGQSIADITITGNGRLPLYIQLGSGDDRVSGTFDLGGQILNLFAGGGTLLLDAQFDNGYAALNGGSAGSTVSTRGSATVGYTGGAGADHVTLGAGNDSLEGGAGTNYLNGGGGTDLASWTSQVRADLLTGEAKSIGAGAAFSDTLVSIENLGGSAFNDVLLGDDRANVIYGVNVSPSPSGDDILAGRGGDDTLWGMDGNDILIGGTGADVLIGGEGDDLLIDAADGWGVNSRNPTAHGGEGKDTLVYLLGATGEIGRGNFMDGGAGADTYVVDASRGAWGDLGLRFSQVDGDKLDLSALRTKSGDVLTLADVKAAASTPFQGSTTIDLSAFADASGHALSGRIVLNDVFAPADLRAGDFVFTGGIDWKAAVPTDLWPTI